MTKRKTTTKRKPKPKAARRRPRSLAQSGFKTGTPFVCEDPWEAAEIRRALAWVEKEFGSLGGSYDPRFTVLLAKGGLVALLARADLSGEPGRREYLQNFSGHGDKQPTLEQLRLANKVRRALEHALSAGDVPELWEQIERASKAIGDRSDRRRAVVHIVAEMSGWIDRTRKYLAGLEARKQEDGSPSRFDTPAHRAEITMDIATKYRRARRSLVAIDPAFGLLRRSHLEAISKRPRPLTSPRGIAAALSVAVNAFGDAAGDGKRSLKPAKRNYELAFE